MITIITIIIIIIRCQVTASTCVHKDHTGRIFALIASSLICAKFCISDITQNATEQEMVLDRTNSTVGPIYNSIYPPPPKYNECM